MTKGNAAQLILSFALPLFIGNVFQMFYNVVDAMVVGRFVGATALAAVGGAGSSYNLMLATINGFTGGASILISQAFGGKDPERMRKTYATSFAVIIATGVLFTFLGETLALPVLKLLKTPDDVIAGSYLYLRWMFAGLLATALYNGMAAFLRAVGNSFTPLIALVGASLLNIVLDLVFVVILHWDIAGVAAATVISQGVSGIYCLLYVNRHMPEMKVKTEDLRFDREITLSIMRLGLPAAFSTAVITSSVMLIQRAVNQYGSTVMAAYTSSSKAENVCFCLGFAMGMATGVFVGQNKGARDYGRVREGLFTGLRITLIYHSVMGAVLFIFGNHIVGLFTTDAEVIRIGSQIVRITACFAPVLGCVFIFQHFLRSVSDVRPTVYMSFAEILCRGILPYVLSAGFGYYGIWWATPAGWTLTLLIGVIRYRSGKWKVVAEAS